MFELGNTGNQDIVIAGNEITVSSKEEWIFYNESRPVLQIFLVQDDLLLIRIEDEIPIGEYTNVFLKIENVIISTNQKISILIYLKPSFLNRETRMFIIREEERLGRYIDRYYFISKGHGRSLLTVYKNMHPVFRNKLLVLNSVNEAILEHIHDKSQEMLDFDRVFPIHPKENDYPVEIKWKEQFLSVRHLKDWYFNNEGMSFCGYLINNRILFYRVQGKIDEENGEFIYTIGKKILKYIERPKAIIVSDYTQVKSITKKARYLFEKLNLKTDVVRLVEYTSSNNLMGAVIALQLIMDSKLNQTMVQSTSIEEALLQALRKANLQDTAPSGQKEIKVEQLTNVQLKKKIRGLIQENNHLVKNRTERIDQLIEMFSKVTWQQDFSTNMPIPDEDDPFYNLFLAFYFLKKDLKQAFEDMESFNNSVELMAKEKSQSILSAKTNLKQLLDHTRDMIILLGKDLKILALNKSFKEFFLMIYELNLNVGDSFKNVLERSILKDFWTESLERAISGNTFEAQKELNSPTGKKIKFLFSFYPLKEKDKVVKLAVYIKDITGLLKSL